MLQGSHEGNHIHTQLLPELPYHCLLYKGFEQKADPAPENPGCSKAHLQQPQLQCLDTDPRGSLCPWPAPGALLLPCRDFQHPGVTELCRQLEGKGKKPESRHGFIPTFTLLFFCLYFFFNRASMQSSPE